MKKWLQMKNGLRPRARLGLLVVVLTALIVGRSPLAHADSLLLATTNLVTGTSAATFSFNTPGSGTVTAQISSMPWPVPLSALSFSATTASATLSSWSTSSAMPAPQIETFQVGAGTYFAHVMATAAGQLNLGLYSLVLSFTPSAVPLPAGAGMLLIGLLVLFALRRTMRLGDLAPLESNKGLMPAQG
jgi:hypothetical protein